VFDKKSMPKIRRRKMKVYKIELTEDLIEILEDDRRDAEPVISAILRQVEKQRKKEEKGVFYAFYSRKAHKEKGKAFYWETPDGKEVIATHITPDSTAEEYDFDDKIALGAVTRHIRTITTTDPTRDGQYREPTREN
jgi:hypothetical protein